MIDRLNHLTSFMNVTAAENGLATYLLNFFRNKKLNVELDRNGCVIVRIFGSKKQKRKIMICTPMDIPGYICLFREGSTSYLTKTSKNSAINEKKQVVYGENGQEFSVKESSFDKKEICVEFSEGKIGDVFRPLPHFEIDENYVYGKHCARYALIDLLMNIASQTPKNDVILCFTSAFYSLGVSDANIVFREKPDEVLMLGFSEDEDDLPLQYVKNGKNFTQDHLLKKINDTSDELNIKTKLKVSETEATKEYSVISSCLDVFSLGLPCKNDEKFEEKISIKAVTDLGKILENYFSA